jgi:hypothetical protein
MAGEQQIHLYCLCWNDARMLPYFFRNYDNVVDKYFVLDNGSTDESLALLRNHRGVDVSHFDVSGDSFVEEERRIGDTVWRNSDADWVIITDIDEHIYHPDLSGYLRRCTDQGITAIQSIGYEMVSDDFPTGGQPLHELVTTGVRSAGHDRLCIFNPRELTATNFSPGRHEASPEGRVIWPEVREVLLLHYKQLGIAYVVVRSAELRRGLRPRDLKRRWGVHYTWSKAKITTEWRKIKSAASPVPGLGALRHLEPAKYFEEDRIIELSGLFDCNWYLATYPDVEAAGTDPLSHYCIYGWREDRQPNFYFDPTWYRVSYPEMLAAGRNPLCDYVVRGESEGAWPSPRFNTDWYRARNGLCIDESPLRHYLTQRSSGHVSPLPDFDVVRYCQSHPEVLAAGDDPFEDHCKRLTKAAEGPTIER